MQKIALSVAGIAILLSVSVATHGRHRRTEVAPSYDLLIANARVVDGTGNPWFDADVGIRGDRIVAVGNLRSVNATRTIDAHHRILAPGFIDLLGASDWELLVDPRAASKVTQGITLLVSGEGSSVAPASDRTLGEQKRLFDKYHVTADWHSLQDFFNRLEANPPTIHFATFVGAGGLRNLVIGKQNRPATTTELAEMERLTAESMEQGAFGISTSLMYVPDRFAGTDEIIALARVAARYGGIYATHQRSLGDGLYASMTEVLQIAREARIPTHIFHLKIAYRQNWGGMPALVERIAAARRDGLDITADVYPYVAASAGMDALMPLWVREGGTEKMLGRLRDPTLREQIKKDLSVSTTEWENEYYGVGGADGILVSSVIDPSLRLFVGQRLSDIAKKQNRDPMDVLMDIVIADRGATGFVSFLTDEPDIRLALRQPWSAFSTDSPIAAVDGPLSEGLPHPRAYGSFPRILGRYTREEHVLNLEDAVRKATSLPAQILGIRDRGLVREGYHADLVIFDPNTVTDRATYENPHQYSTGIDYVMVDGTVVVDDGKITAARPGKVLRGPGYPRR